MARPRLPGCKTRSPASPPTFRRRSPRCWQRSGRPRLGSPSLISCAPVSTRSSRRRSSTRPRCARSPRPKSSAR
ncbi:short-chain dehydrogenase [Rhodobacter capsulatus YW1]|nr:short-chain dehydrogenase [Rhodobacter capsulatus YW1]